MRKPATRGSDSEHPLCPLPLVAGLALATAGSVDAQVLERLGNAAKREAEYETQRQVQKSIDWESASLTVAASGDLASEPGTWTFDPDGPGILPSTSGYLTVHEKIDGRWMVAADVGVADAGSTVARRTGS